MWKPNEKIINKNKFPKPCKFRVFDFNSQLLYSYIILIVVLVIRHCECADPDLPFCYEDPSCGPYTWGGLCNTGRMQTPINLESWNVKKIPKSVNLVLSREYAQLLPFLIRNDGRTVSVSLRLEDRMRCMVKGNGFLPNEPWVFSSMHFHWGPHDLIGSEHNINGQKFPLELHMIHQQKSDEKKLAVFGILYKISEYDNPTLNTIIDNLPRVQNFSALSSEYIEPYAGYFINLTAFIPNKIKVFRYQGSKTTPPCAEGVVWTVFDDVQTVSKRQMAELRKMIGSTGQQIRTNFRPIQPTFTDQRKVVYYMKSIVPSRGGAIKKKKG